IVRGPFCRFGSGMKLCTLQPTGDWLFCKRLPVSAYRAGLYSRLGACQEWCWRTHVACLRQDWGVGRSLPPLVIVYGPPASGKSTIADNLARSLGVPVLGKDLVKERMMDHLGGSEDGGAARPAAPGERGRVRRTRPGAAYAGRGYDGRHGSARA